MVPCDLRGKCWKLRLERRLGSKGEGFVDCGKEFVLVLIASDFQSFGFVAHLQMLEFLAGQWEILKVWKHETSLQQSPHKHCTV